MVVLSLSLPFAWYDWLDRVDMYNQQFSSPIFSSTLTLLYRELLLSFIANRVLGLCSLWQPVGSGLCIALSWSMCQGVH